jgi:UDPglucose 6-dehydrogenase
VDVGARVRTADPEGMKRAYLVAAEVDYAEGADVLVIVTEWDLFAALDLSRPKAALNQPILVNQKTSTELIKCERPA